MYIVVVLLAIVPLVLFVTGVFTSAYMFVALNLALLIFSSVTIFHYFGTYMLQRARKGLATKYIFTQVMMAITMAGAAIITIVVVAILALLGANVSIIEHMGVFLEKWDIVDFILKAICMLCTICTALGVAGFLYHLTQNIIYSSVPTLILSFSNIILLQRVREASSFLAAAEVNLVDYTSKLESAVASGNQKNIANYQAKIAEIEANLVPETVSMVLSYIFMALIILALVAIGVYAVIRLIANIAAAKKARKAK